MGRRGAIGAAVERPIAVDLFSGAGGFALGVEQAGFDVVAAVEYDPVHAAVHSFNFPKTSVICASVAELSGADVRRAAAGGCARYGRRLGEIDLMFGGPPCQGFSTIGKRKAGDVRNKLSFAFARLVGDLSPRYFVLENVPGMPSVLGLKGSLIDELTHAFSEHGYRVSPHYVLNAASFGVPQDRRRLFVVGARHDQSEPQVPRATVWPVPKRPGLRAYATSSPSQLLPRGPIVWDAIGDLPQDVQGVVAL